MNGGQHRTALAPRAAAERRRPVRPRGFTLMETALAIVIVASGVLSIMFAQQAFLKDNNWSSRLSTATYLANEIREMMIRLPRHDPITQAAFWGPESNELYVEDFDDLDDFDGGDSLGLTFSAEDGNGPLDAMRRVVPNMNGWSQTIRVFNVPANDVSVPGDNALDGTTDMMRIEVQVSYQEPGQADPAVVTEMRWISRK